MPKMSISTPVSPCRYHEPFYAGRANYLSNPDVEFEGVKTGSVSSNNAKVLKETRFRSAAVGDESLVPPGLCFKLIALYSNYNTFTVSS